MLFKQPLILLAAILVAQVAVQNHILRVAALFSGVFKAFYDKFLCHPGAHRPAYV